MARKASALPEPRGAISAHRRCPESRFCPWLSQALQRQIPFFFAVAVILLPLNKSDANLLLDCVIESDFYRESASLDLERLESIMELLEDKSFYFRFGAGSFGPTDPFTGRANKQAGAQWPELHELGLSVSQIERRRTGLGGSDANILMSGNRDAIISLWREKRGEQAPPDLSALLPVMLGQWTEAFNRQWFERIDGRKVNSVGIELVCPVDQWRRCTLDGIVGETGAIWEAKHTNAFTRPDEILERYMPQLQHNMAVAKSDLAVLSVIFGNHKFEIFEVASDWIYQLELLDAEQDFWECVQTGREPVPFLAPPPPRPVGIREICLDGNNAWADAAETWLGNRDAAQRHAAVCKAIKEMVEPDVARAFGHGVEAKRSKSGAISIKEMPR